MCGNLILIYQNRILFLIRGSLEVIIFRYAIDSPDVLDESLSLCFPSLPVSGSNVKTAVFESPFSAKDESLATTYF